MRRLLWPLLCCLFWASASYAEKAARPELSMKSFLKEGATVYRLDDRVDGKLRCDAWSFSPSKKDPNQGSLTLSYKTKDRKMVFVYDYEIFYRKTWRLEINGNALHEILFAGVQLDQKVICKEDHSIGAMSKTELEIGGGLWYLSKSACESAKKKKAKKSPGSC